MSGLALLGERGAASCKRAGTSVCKGDSVYGGYHEKKKNILFVLSVVVCFHDGINTVAKGALRPPPAAVLGLGRDVLAAALDVGLLSLTLYKTTSASGAPGGPRGLSCGSVIRSCSETMAALLGTPSPQDLTGCRLELLVEHPRQRAHLEVRRRMHSTVLYGMVVYHAALYCTVLCFVWLALGRWVSHMCVILVQCFPAFWACPSCAYPWALGFINRCMLLTTSCH